MPVKGVMGIITDRLLRTIEYVYPFFITLLMLYMSKYMFSQFQVFEKMYDMNIILLYFASGGFGLFLIGDFVKIAMMKQQEVMNKLGLKAKMDRLEIKRLKKNNKAQKRALEVERELAELKGLPAIVPLPEEEPEPTPE